MMPAQSAVMPTAPKDSLGCSKSQLSADHVLLSGKMVFRRKAAQGHHQSDVETPAQDRGLLVGVSLVDGHRRTGGRPGHPQDQLFDRGQIYIRDFDSAYTARMDGMFDFFLVELAPDFLASVDDLTDRPGALVRVQGAEDQILRHLALALLPALADPDAADALFVEQLSVAIGAHLLHRHRGTAPDAAVRLAPLAIRRAQEILIEGIDETASIAQIARTLDMSRNAFFRSFRATVGVTPYQWLLSKRVEHARRLLLTTDLPLVEVALSCGFSDQSHFTRVFSRIEGMSPGRWRIRAR